LSFGEEMIVARELCTAAVQFHDRVGADVLEP